MIALQARNPQLPDPASQTARYANMMNMAKQQEAAQRQALLAQQTMDINQAQEARAAALQPSALTKAEGDAGVAKIKYFMDFVKASANDIANSSTPEQAIARGERLKQQFTDPALQARIDETIGELVSDPSKFEENRKRILIRTLDTKDQFAESHSDIFDANGDLLNKVTSPIGAFSTRITPGVVTDLPSTATQAAPPRATPTAGAGTSANMRATQGANTTPQDLMNQGMNPRNIPSGMPTSPASFTGGMGGANAAQITPEVMSRIVDSAFQTGVMAQVDFDQLLATQPPENRQAFTDAFRRANVTLQADAPSLADSGMGQQQMAANPVQRPQAGFAVMRGPTPQSRTANLGGDMPMMRNTEAQYQVGQQVKGRNPNMAPYPGSAQVSPNIIRGQAAAEEGGKQDVRVGAEPVIAGKTKTAQLRAEKDAAFSDAQSQFDAAYTTVNNRLSDIKRFKAHPAATRVIGPLDAFTPNFGRARGAQQIYDTLVASATFDALQEMRINSPTGGALGNVSDADIRLLKESIGALGQAQNEEDFFESLRIYEDRLKQVRDRLVNRYRQSYGYRLSKDWKPPVTSSSPRTSTKTGRKAGGFTVTEVDE